MNKFYITTAIDYVNDKPHIGHAYEKIIADVLARYHRAKGDDVFFLTGTDEHGEKIYKAAQKAGRDTQEFVDEFAGIFKKLCESLDISNDDFIRTTNPEHERIVQEAIKKIYEKGDIYEGEYEGWYCTPCESYWTETQLVEGKCPQCDRETQKLKEKSYFFKLSKYEEPLLKLYEENPEFVFPANKQKELLNRIKEGLRDLSITRRAFEWGVPFPIDSNYATYVWVEALSNYITALDYPGKNFERYWPADIHLIGKDITWFHAVIWPAWLMSLGVEPPKQIAAHGFLTVDGEKMSKSKGNVVDPLEIVDKYGADALKYALLSESSFGEDGDFSEKRLTTKYNNELADVLGNFVHRTLTFVYNNFDGKLPEEGDLTDEDKKLIKQTEETVDKVGANLEKLDLKNALGEAIALARHGNQYINANEPWKNKERAPTVLNVCTNLCRSLSIVLAPFIPGSAERLWTQLNLDGSVHGQKWIEAKNFVLKNHEIKKPEPLFKKIIYEEKKPAGEVKHFDFSISPEVRKLGINAFGAELRGLTIKKKVSALEKAKKELAEEVKKLSDEEIRNNPVINGYQEAYVAVGKKRGELTPSGEVMTKYIREKGKLPTINSVVDSYNLVAAKYYLALGAHDIDKINGNVELAIADGTELYIPLGESKPLKISPGEYIFKDDKKVLCRLDVKQGDQTRITDSTKDVWIYVQGNKNTSDEYLKKALKEACENIVKYCGGSYTLKETTE